VPKPPRETETENNKPQFHSLSEETRESLVNKLGLDPSVNPEDQENAARAIIQTEQILRLYWRNLENFESLPGSRKRGRPKQEVFQKTLGDLRRTFKQYSVQIDNKRKIEGPIVKLSPAESEEREFIHLALKDADIPHPTLEKLRRSYHRQGTPLADRNQVIKNIEEEAERRLREAKRKEAERKEAERRAKISADKGDKTKK
jgi:hypothetical protein